VFCWLMGEVHVGLALTIDVIKSHKNISSINVMFTRLFASVICSVS
jgi:hypothetical protein